MPYHIHYHPIILLHPIFCHHFFPLECFALRRGTRRWSGCGRRASTSRIALSGSRRWRFRTDPALTTFGRFMFFLFPPRFLPKLVIMYFYFWFYQPSFSPHNYSALLCIFFIIAMVAMNAPYSGRVCFPTPKKEFLLQTFAAFADAQPWVGDRHRCRREPFFPHCYCVSV